MTGDGAVAQGAGALAIGAGATVHFAKAPDETPGGSAPTAASGAQGLGPSGAGPAARKKTGVVFISYSHKDTKWIAALRTHLKPLADAGLLRTWDDSKIQPGQLWSPEIDQALADADIGVLLISAHFLGSDLITQREMPALLAARQERDLTLLPLYLDHSTPEHQVYRYPDRHGMSHTLRLADLQGVNAPDQPLAAQRGAQRTRALRDAALVIMRAAGSTRT